MTYSAHRLVDGFPGKSASHGSFGWSSVHLLHGAGRVILVETGPPSYIPLLTVALARHALERDAVTDILLTHAHWDHLSNIAMFPRARVWIGARELAWARTLSADTPFISILHVDELRRRGAELLSDGDQPLPGITAVDTAGHTPGHLAYTVDAADLAGVTGPIVFAGDAVKNLNELTTAEADSTMDADASRASIRRLQGFLRPGGGLLVPGHDVPLRRASAGFVRTALQRAQISFFADGDAPAQDRSVSDRPGGATDHPDLTTTDPSHHRDTAPESLPQGRPPAAR